MTKDLRRFAADVLLGVEREPEAMTRVEEYLQLIISQLDVSDDDQYELFHFLSALRIACDPAGASEYKIEIVVARCFRYSLR